MFPYPLPSPADASLIRAIFPDASDFCGDGPMLSSSSSESGISMNIRFRFWLPVGGSSILGVAPVSSSMLDRGSSASGDRFGVSELRIGGEACLLCRHAVPCSLAPSGSSSRTEWRLS